MKWTGGWRRVQGKGGEGARAAEFKVAESRDESKACLSPVYLPDRVESFGSADLAVRSKQR
jgi:hypothetical protein